MRVFGSTLFSCVPFTTRFLNADPAMLTEALKPVAFALATARTTSAVTRPPSTLTPADSATPVSVAALLAGSTVLVLDAVSTLALRSGCGGGGTASTWLPLLVEPGPDCELQAPCVQSAGVAAGSVVSSPSSESCKRAAKAFPLAFAPAGLKTVKFTGMVLVRSLSSALSDVEARLFIVTKRTWLQAMVPIVSLTLSASSPNRLEASFMVALTAMRPVIGPGLTAASQRIPWLAVPSWTNVAPFHLKALTVIVPALTLVSNATRKSPTLRFGICKQPGLAGLTAGSFWLNS